ncbi:hypothetical protein [uncultured Psychroserpens sp.]|uniref:hypothetical protein n=1 Tax=uncultured Psychroserpens sp. TaxID=255436 RepID=UPI0026267532|nr:hypothetical protein [uncultured Psychroserpens sp.]
MLKKNLVYLILSLLLFSCNSDDDTAEEVCGDSIIIDATLFQLDSPSNFDIIDAEITDDCIAITIFASGCDMSTWQADLVTDGLQTDSTPPYRLLRLNFSSQEPCEAGFLKTYQFYLGNETQTVIYSLEDWDEQLIHNE